MDYGRNGELLVCDEAGVHHVLVRKHLQRLQLPGAGLHKRCSTRLP